MPKSFKIQELVDKATYEKWGDKSIWFLDPVMLNLIQYFRNTFGPITINNWHIGGDRQWSGLRTPRSPYYKQWSQHSFGRAADMLFSDVTPSEIDKYILDNEYDMKRMGLGGVELGKTWNHIDSRLTDKLIKFYR